MTVQLRGQRRRAWTRVELLCSSCSTSWVASARFCTRCGAPRPLEVRPHLDAAPGWRVARVLAGSLAVGVVLVAPLVAWQAGAPPPRGVTSGATQDADGRSVVELPVDSGSVATADDHEDCRWLDGRDWGCRPPALGDVAARGADGGGPPSGAVVIAVVEGGGHGRPAPAAAPADAVLLALDADSMTRLDPRTGAPLWSARLSAPEQALSRVWVLDGDLLVLDAAGRLSAVRGSEGRVSWTRAGFRDDALMTSFGLVVGRGTALGAWHPSGPEPLWLHDDPAAEAGGLPARSVVGSVINPYGRDPLSAASLVLPPGLVIDVRADVDDLSRVLVTWSVTGDGMHVYARGRDGEVIWQRSGLDLSCCDVALVPAGPGRIAVTSRNGEAALLAAADGRELARLERPGARLGAVLGDLALWRSAGSVIGVDVGSQEQVFEVPGEIVSYEPLLVAGPEEVRRISVDTPDQRSQREPPITTP